jgi:predicted ester cyclase
MAQPGIELVRDLIARFFNGHNPDLAPAFFDPYFCWHGGSVGTIQGIDGYAAVMRQFFAALPDAEAIEQDAAQDGDTVTMRFVVQGTHTGALWGIAPTGNRVVWDVIMMYRLSNGMVFEQWAAEDWTAFLHAIGVFTPQWALWPQRASHSVGRVSRRTFLTVTGLDRRLYGFSLRDG